MASYETPVGTLSYPHFYTPRPRAKGAEPVYSGMLMFTKKQMASPEFKALMAACVACAKEGAPKKSFERGLRSPFRSADERDNLPEEIECFINPWTKNKPGVVNGKREYIIDSDEVWAGQWACMNVTPFFYENSGNVGVSLALNHVQIVKSKGLKRLDGRKAADEVFSDKYAYLEDEEDGNSEEEF